MPCCLNLPRHRPDSTGRLRRWTLTGLQIGYFPLLVWYPVSLSDYCSLAFGVFDLGSFVVKAAWSIPKSRAPSFNHRRLLKPIAVFDPQTGLPFGVRRCRLPGSANYFQV